MAKQLRHEDTDEGGATPVMAPAVPPAREISADINNPFKGMFAGKPVSAPRVTPEPYIPEEYGITAHQEPYNLRDPQYDPYNPILRYDRPDGERGDKLEHAKKPGRKVIQAKPVDIGDVEVPSRYLGEADAPGFAPEGPPSLTGDPKADIEILKQALAVQALQLNPNGILGVSHTDPGTGMSESEAGAVPYNFYATAEQAAKTSVPLGEGKFSTPEDAESYETRAEDRARGGRDALRDTMNREAATIHPELFPLLGKPRTFQGT